MFLLGGYVFSYCCTSSTIFRRVIATQPLSRHYSLIPKSPSAGFIYLPMVSKSSGSKLRRSARLRELSVSVTANHKSNYESSRNQTKNAPPPHNRPKSVKAKAKKTPKVSEPRDCLLRLREEELLSSKNTSYSHILGIDEAGRGPLAGPVVAAAVFVPTNIPGIVDSKKITKEEEREFLYEQIVASPGVRWAIAVVDAARIDEINILQATMEGMSMAAAAVMGNLNHNDKPTIHFQRAEVASISEKGCYVVCGERNASIDVIQHKDRDDMDLCPKTVYALVDGNRIPQNMPCEAEPIVKGDSKEYAIAAASVLAKVTRDRLMHEYHKEYPEYGLKQHKGYPTAAHMAAVHKHGASAIHRRSFAPLKHMNLDEDGSIIKDS